jgi:tetratricopeptide (TPR) repeat protein
MGCGKVSKTRDTIDQRPVRKRVTNEHIEDIDDVKNKAANRRQSIHMNSIMEAESMLQLAKTDKEKAVVYNMKGEYYFSFACTMRQNRNLDYFIIYRKSMRMFKTAYELDCKNILSIMGIAKCLVNLHQYEKAVKHLEKNSKHLDLFKHEEFWTLIGICKLKHAKIWQGKSHFSSTFENLQMAAQCLDKAIGLKSGNTEVLRQRKIANNLLNTHAKYNGDIHEYIESMKTNTLAYDMSQRPHKPDKEFYKILSIDGGGMRYTKLFEKPL